MNGKEDSMITNPIKKKIDPVSMTVVAILLLYLITTILYFASFVLSAEDRLKKSYIENQAKIQECLKLPNPVVKFDKNNKYNGCYSGNGLAPMGADH